MFFVLTCNFVQRAEGKACRQSSSSSSSSSSSRNVGTSRGSLQAGVITYKQSTAYLRYLTYTVPNLKNDGKVR